MLSKPPHPELPHGELDEPRRTAGAFIVLGYYKTTRSSPTCLSPRRRGTGAEQAAVLAEPLNHNPKPCSDPRFHGDERKYRDIVYPKLDE